MLIVGSAGAMLVTLAYLENRGKLSVNQSTLFIISIFITAAVGWKIIEQLLKTFLLTI